MKTKFLIIGSGLSGLMCGLELSRRGEDYTVIDKQQSPPSAKLHYLHSDMSDFFPFRLREVDIIYNAFWKDEFVNNVSIEMMNRFAHITVGKIVQNSVKYIDGKIHKGWIPEVGMENLSDAIRSFNKGNFMIGTELLYLNTSDKIANTSSGAIEYEHVINTMPLPQLLKINGVETNLEFKNEPLHMVNIQIPEEFYEDLWQIIYFPAGDFGISRLSILGKRVIVEKVRGEDVELSDYGLWQLLKRILPSLDIPMIESQIMFKHETNWFGRYVSVPEVPRLRILQELRQKDIHCIGRYASWSYKRTDHTAKDIVKLLDNINNYGKEKI